MTETIATPLAEPAVALPSPTTTPPGGWTLDTIYQPDEFARYGATVPPDIESIWDTSRFGHHTYTREFCDALGRESRWTHEPLHTDDMVAFRLAMNGKGACPVCGGSVGGYASVLHTGLDTGLQVLRDLPCPCRVGKLFREQWAKAMASHARFDAVRLSSLKPVAGKGILPVERQAEIIDQLRAAPAECYLLTGTPNTGKTHFLTALFAEALWLWARQVFAKPHYEQSVWRISTAQMLEEHVAWSSRDKEEHSLKPPTVTRELIQAIASRRYRPCLFLDEIDKFKPTEFKLDKLIEIVDAVYEAKGQVVATCNKGFAELAEKWGADEAGTILRRIGAGPGANTVQFG